MSKIYVTYLMTSDRKNMRLIKRPQFQVFIKRNKTLLLKSRKIVRGYFAR